MKLHEKIFNQRKLKCLSQEELAEKLGVSRQAVSKWETGEALPEITKLKALAEVFGVTTDFLLNDNEDVFFSQEAKKADPFDKFYSWLDALPAKLAPFFKRYGWLGGILLIVIGAYRAVTSLLGALSFTGAPGGFGIPVFLMMFMNAAVGVAVIVAGVIVIKKFKPKKNSDE
jgi:transcriptional regulator with XRE-family HTH domain